jgi:hypothetical protein
MRVTWCTRFHGSGLLVSFDLELLLKYDDVSAQSRFDSWASFPKAQYEPVSFVIVLVLHIKGVKLGLCEMIHLPLLELCFFILEMYQHVGRFVTCWGGGGG